LGLDRRIGRGRERRKGETRPMNLLEMRMEARWMSSGEELTIKMGLDSPDLARPEVPMMKR